MPAPSPARGAVPEGTNPLAVAGKRRPAAWSNPAPPARSLAGLRARLLPGRARAPLDRLVTIDEVATRLSVKVDWLRPQRALPFLVRLSPGQVRYSEQGIERYIRGLLKS